jgi:hypothetical protein
MGIERGERRERRGSPRLEEGEWLCEMIEEREKRG